MALFKIEKTTKNYFLSTAFLLGLATLVCVFFPQIMTVFALCGGLFCTFVGWTVPFILRLKTLSDLRWYQLPKLNYIIGLVFILFITIASTLQSIFHFEF